MATCYQQAKELDGRIDSLMRLYHKPLVDCEVRVGCAWVTKAEDEEGDSGPPLKHNGYPAAAVVEVTKVKQRLFGMPDAVIWIDKEHWEDLNETEQDALLDHELTHLEIAKDKEGELKSDDQGRPVLKIRLHDFQIGGFDSVVRRWGAGSLEQQQVHKTYIKQTEQLRFRFDELIDSAKAAGAESVTIEAGGSSVTLAASTADETAPPRMTVHEAIERLQGIEKSADEITDGESDFSGEAIEFAASVRDNAEAMLETVQRNGKVSKNQRAAILHWERGLEKWLEPAGAAL